MRAGALFASLCLALVSACGNARSGQAAPAAATDASALSTLTIRGPDATRRFRVEVARTPAEQARGLMYRTELAADGGMLFPFDPPRPAAFWMKNTYIPLDIIFIGVDRRIARIAARTVPYSLEPVESGVPVVAVLELAGGTAQAQGIAVGDRVDW